MSGALFQLDDEEFDCHGDVGTIGRCKVRKHRVDLDLKGILYQGTPYTTATLCTVVAVDGKAEIKVSCLR